MDYSKLSDFEVNKKVALEMGYPVRGKQNFSDDGLSVVMLEPGFGGHFDPCNNPADAWRIIVENGIAVSPARNRLSTAWPGPVGPYTRFTAEDKNPLRAAMLVFLKMREPYKKGAKHA